VLWLYYGITGTWLMWKLALVLILICFHGFLTVQVKAFAENRNTLSRKHYILLNEIPVIPLIGGVLLVIFKP
jgi:putative membrane protein